VDVYDSDYTNGTVCDRIRGGNAVRTHGRVWSFLSVAKNTGALLLFTMHVAPNGSINESAQSANLWKCNVFASFLPLLSLSMIPFLIPKDLMALQIINHGDENSATEGSIWRRCMGHGVSYMALDHTIQHSPSMTRSGDAGTENCTSCGILSCSGTLSDPCSA